jgi:4-hydroxy-tetrahydrodipicolinate synthase
MIKRKLTGIVPMIYCFFDKRNQIDKKFIEDEIKLINSLNVKGIACLGLGTEVNKLSFNEKIQIIELISKYKNKNTYLTITISGENYNDQLKLIKIANIHKADWLILQPPAKKKLSENECLNFFDSIIKNVNKNTYIGIQNAPEYLKSSLSTQNVLKLYKKYKNFRYIKGEGTAKILAPIIKSYPKDLKVFNGRAGLEIIESLMSGCQGIMPSVEFSDKLNEIYLLIKKENLINAKKKYHLIEPYIKFVMKDIPTFICYGKRIFAYRMGVNKIFDRKPYLKASNYGIKKSKIIANNLGIY